MARPYKSRGGLYIGWQLGDEYYGDDVMDFKRIGRLLRKRDEKISSLKAWCAAERVGETDRHVLWSSVMSDYGRKIERCVADEEQIPVNKYAIERDAESTALLYHMLLKRGLPDAYAIRCVEAFIKSGSCDEESEEEEKVEGDIDGGSPNGRLPAPEKILGGI